MPLHRPRPSEWSRLRDLRLRCLLEDPDAFGSTHADTVGRPPEHWQQRLGAADQVFFIGVLDGEDCGLVCSGAWPGRPGVAGLFSMWVAPEARGRGLGEALIEGVITWATEQGFERVVLDVGDDNPNAIALYARCGFERTGRVGTLPSPRDHLREHERERRL